MEELVTLFYRVFLTWLMSRRNEMKTKWLDLGGKENLKQDDTGKVENVTIVQLPRTARPSVTFDTC